MADVDRELVSAVEEALKLNAKSVSDTKIIDSTNTVTSIPVVDESGEVVRLSMNAIGAKTVDFSQLDSLNAPARCGRYAVKLNGIVVGALDVATNSEGKSILQRFTTSAAIMDPDSDDVTRFARVRVYDRFYNHYGSTLDGVRNMTWSEWRKLADALDIAQLNISGAFPESGRSVFNEEYWKPIPFDERYMQFQYDMSYVPGSIVNMPDDTDYTYESLKMNTGPTLPPYEKGNRYTLKSAIAILPAQFEKEGFKVTFLSYETNEWVTYQFKGHYWNNPYDWKEMYNLDICMKYVKWDGTIVHDVQTEYMSYTGDDGKVVLCQSSDGTERFLYEVGTKTKIVGGNTGSKKYYQSWMNKTSNYLDYQKDLGGFYDYLLYVSPASLWMKGEEEKLIRLSVKSYGDLTDKPQINGLELVGNKSWFDLKLAGTRTNDEGEIFNDPSNVAIGIGAHAEGTSTSALRTSSHTQGLYTEARNVGEHAGGKYNVSKKSDDRSLATAFSHGNGTGTNYRSNAIEVKENGDTYIAGNKFIYNANGAEPKDLIQQVNNISDIVIPGSTILKYAPKDEFVEIPEGYSLSALEAYCCFQINGETGEFILFTLTGSDRMCSSVAFTGSRFYMIAINIISEMVDDKFKVLSCNLVKAIDVVDGAECTFDIMSFSSDISMLLVKD